MIDNYFIFFTTLNRKMLLYDFLIKSNFIIETILTLTVTGTFAVDLFTPTVFSVTIFNTIAASS